MTTTGGRKVRAQALRVAAPRLAAAFLVAMAARTATADEYCVGSASELDAALAASQTAAAGTTTTVKVKTGTYHLDGTLLDGLVVYYTGLELLGGYNADCSARTINPANTIFDADGDTFLAIGVYDVLLIEGIRFRNIANKHQVEIYGGGDNTTVRLRLNEFDGVAPWIVPIGDHSGMTVKFIDNLVHGFPGFASAPAVYIAAATQIRFTGNTIADNNGAAGVDVCGSSDVAMIDNIGWNNAGDDFLVRADCGANDQGDVQFKTNLYQNITLHTVGDSGSNVANSDPLFVNAAAGNYRLQDASPAINVGFVTSSMTGTDLDGNARVVGSTVDLGAYESGIDDTIPTTITVTTTADSGAGSLRQAILDANANPDFNFINFNITGACPRFISPSSGDLPAITHGVRIDGFSQPGSASNTRAAGDDATRCIVLGGGGGATNGLLFTGPGTDQFWVQGLAFAAFSPGTSQGVALNVQGGTNNIVRGNQFGGTLKTPGGPLSVLPSDTNIRLTSVSKTTVGGDSPSARNVIAGAAFGIKVNKAGIFASSNNTIAGNLIGSYGSTEANDAGNLVGIQIQTSGNEVRNNTIIYNYGGDFLGGAGILLSGAGAFGNTIQNNRIGVEDAFCFGSPISICLAAAAPNGYGISISDSTHDNLIQYNLIADNHDAGVVVDSSGTAPQHEEIGGNAIYNNGTGTFYATLLGAVGSDVGGPDNDGAAGAASLPNRGLNYPVITSAYGGTRKGWVEGTLASINDGYLIQVFSSLPPPSGTRREGQLFHRTGVTTIANAAAGQNGSTSFKLPFPSSSASLAGRAITLTAIDYEGDSSEYSEPVAYQCVVIFAHGFDDGVGDRCP